LPAAVADLLNDDVLTDDALDIAARGTGGYPSLIQLVGYWNCKLPYTGRAEVLITESAAVAGVQAARRRLGSLVHEPAPARLVRGGPHLSWPRWRSMTDPPGGPTSPNAWTRTTPASTGSSPPT
jgi:hypothetical protein